MRRFNATGMLCVGIALLPVTAAAAAVSSDELARCAAITSGETRLACYDALARQAGEDTRQSGPAATAARPSEHLAAALPGAAAASDVPTGFGLSPAQRRVAEVGPSKQSARIVSLTANQTGHAVVVLDNGQTWTVLDNDGFLSSNVDVTIKRAALGSYLMTSPSHHVYRVHRDK